MGSTKSVDGVSYGTPSLLGLPLDVQKKIYAYAVVIEHIIDLTKKSFQTYSALLNACTKTREAATPIFFSKNKFIVSGMGSYGSNYVKHAEGHITKLYVDFSITPELHKRYPNSSDGDSKDVSALMDEVKDYPESMVGLLLTFEVSVDAIELVGPDPKSKKPASHLMMMVLLNILFMEYLKNQSQPDMMEKRRIMKQKMEEILNRDSKSTGKDAKLAMKDLDFGRKVAAKLNGGKGCGIGALGIESGNFEAYLKAEEAAKAIGSKGTGGPGAKKEVLDAVGVKKEVADAYIAGEKKKHKKSKNKKNKKQTKKDAGEEGEAEQPLRVADFGDVVVLY